MGGEKHLLDLGLFHRSFIRYVSTTYFVPRAVVLALQPTHTMPLGKSLLRASGSLFHLWENTHIGRREMFIPAGGKYIWKLLAYWWSFERPSIPITFIDRADGVLTIPLLLMWKLDQPSGILLEGLITGVLSMETVICHADGVTQFPRFLHQCFIDHPFREVLRGNNKTSHKFLCDTKCFINAKWSFLFISRFNCGKTF